MPRQFILYDTECGHITRLPITAAFSYPFACRTCKKITQIAQVHVSEWHAFCLFHKCPYSAWTGMSKNLAEEAANRHARNAVNHSIYIQVEYMPNPVAVAHKNKLAVNGILA